jgi:hypothetical protein
VRWTALLAVALGAATTGCASSGASSLVSAPPTTASSAAPPVTVPPLGLTPAVLPATQANAEANARGACSRFDIVYIRLAQGVVPSARASAAVGAVTPFADAAGAGDGAQWGQLRTDVAGLAAATVAPTWTTGGPQAYLPAVRAVYDDCASLQ